MVIYSKKIGLFAEDRIDTLNCKTNKGRLKLRQPLKTN